MPTLVSRVAALEALLLGPSRDVPTPTIQALLERAQILAPELGRRLGPWQDGDQSPRRLSPSLDVTVELAPRPDGWMLYVEGPRSPTGIRDVWRVPIAATVLDTAKSHADTVLFIAGFRLGS